MKKLPQDIENKIDKLFVDQVENRNVKDRIIGLWVISLNVGAGQLARSILTISGSDFEKCMNAFQTNFYGDPRDLIMEAEKKLGNPGHCFIPTFDEIERGEM